MNLVVAEAWRRPVRTATVVQVITTLPLLLILDGGVLLATYLAVSLATWVLLLIVVLMRPQPGRLETSLVPFAPLLALAVTIVPSSLGHGW
jgi:hypothetical protein